MSSDQINISQASLTSTQRYFLKKNKTDYIKQSLSPVKAHRNIIMDKTQNSFRISTKELRVQLQQMLKTDTLGIFTEIEDLADVLLYYKTIESPYEMNTSSLLSTKDIQKRVKEIENGNKIEFSSYYSSIIEASQNLQKMYTDYGCQSKEELIVSISIENNYMKLFLNKLNDMTFLFNLKYLNDDGIFNSRYKDTLSRFENIKYMIDKTKEKLNELNEANNVINNNINSTLKDTRNNNKNRNENDDNNNEILQKMSFASSSGYAHDIEYNDNYNANGDLNELLMGMQTFPEFLTYDTDNNCNIKDGINHIKDLFYDYYQKTYQLMLELITDKLHINGPLINKIRTVLKNKVSDCLENVALMRKVIEDKFDSLTKDNLETKTQNEQINQRLSQLERDNDTLIKRINDMNNTDFKNYLKLIKKEINIKDIEGKRNEALYEEIKEKAHKADELKSQVVTLKKEIDILHQKIEFGSMFPYKKNNDDYCEALRGQLENMKKGFIEKINYINADHSYKKIALRKQISTLSDEKKTSIALQNLLMKRINDLESYFH